MQLLSEMMELWLGDEEASCLFAFLFMQRLPAWMSVLLEADSDDSESRPPARSAWAQAYGHCRGGGGYGGPVRGKRSQRCSEGLTARRRRRQPAWRTDLGATSSTALMRCAAASGSHRESMFRRRFFCPGCLNAQPTSCFVDPNCPRSSCGLVPHHRTWSPGGVVFMRS
jgi:hypothetical protein